MGQAVSERRPLRRRPDTMARPARVRIRSRKPCTLARRRLFGWKVRLPLATAPHSLSRLATAAGGLNIHRVLRLPLLSFTRTGAVPQQGRSRAATCGRLFEGTEVASAGQTSLLGPAHGAVPKPPRLRLAPTPKPVSFGLSEDIDRRLPVPSVTPKLLPICCVLEMFPELCTSVDNYVDSLGMNLLTAARL